MYIYIYTYEYIRIQCVNEKDSKNLETLVFLNLLTELR